MAIPLRYIATGEGHVRQEKQIDENITIDFTLFVGVSARLPCFCSGTGVSRKGIL
jgi:hypothetical protein